MALFACVFIPVEGSLCLFISRSNEITVHFPLASLGLMPFEACATGRGAESAPANALTLFAWSNEEILTYRLPCQLAHLFFALNLASQFHLQLFPP